MRWVGHVAHMGESRGAYRFWWGNLREIDHLEDQGIEGRIILRWIFRLWDEGTCKHGNEYLDSTQCGNFLTT